MNDLVGRRANRAIAAGDFFYPADLSEQDWESQRDKLVFARRDYYLDNHPAARWLECDDLASQVLVLNLCCAGDDMVSGWLNDAAGSGVPLE